MIRLRGKIFTGRGEGEFYVNLYARRFEEVLGYRPYPGTLNIELYEESARTWRRFQETIRPIIVEPPRLGLEGYKLARVLCYPAQINGVEGHVVVPEISIYGPEIVELVSRKKLREVLDICDGDEVVIEIEEPENGPR